MQREWCEETDRWCRGGVKACVRAACGVRACVVFVRAVVALEDPTENRSILYILYYI